MDTTPEYIKMCEKAEALRSVWKPAKGDWFVYAGRVYVIGRGLMEYESDIEKGKPQADVEIVTGDPAFDDFEGPAILYYDGYDGANSFPLKECVPLWRQDQLQEMLEDVDSIGLAGLLRDYVMQKDARGSLEQIWLKIIMGGEFGKVWTGEDWIDA